MINGSMTEVLIIGAGPVGLTLANELVRHGVRPRIVDKSPGIREVSKALILHVRTQEMLDKVGIMPSVLAEARPLTRVVVNAYGKTIGSWKLDGIDGPYGNPLIIGQNRTQHLLESHLESRGISVEWGTEAAKVEIDPAGVNVVLSKRGAGSDGNVTESVRADYVVGCEGSNSLVRKAVGATFEGERYAGEQFIQADCRIRWAMPAGQSHLFLTSDGYMMVIEMPGDTVRIFISIPDLKDERSELKSAGAVEDTSHEPTLEEIGRHFTRLTGIAPELSDATWLARYRTSHRYANSFGGGRAFIAGDAAHVHVPIGGQGMNTGIHDAFNLGWKLAGVVRGRYGHGLLGSYHEERYPIARGLIKGTDIAYRGLLHPSQFKQQAARLLGPMIVRTGWAQNFMRNTLEELKISFEASPLNADHGGATGPKPGERVLDGNLVRWSDRRTVSLNELSRTTKWTLLVFGGTKGAAAVELMAEIAESLEAQWRGQLECFTILAATAVPPGCPRMDSTLMDPCQELHRKYGVSRPAIYLLRPDCCVAFRGPILARPEVGTYLGRVFRAS